MKLARLAEPHYIFRPTQVVRRVAWEVGGRDRKSVADVRLPWGLQLTVNPSEAIGSGIARTGVHDLIATEVAWRLMAPGGLAVDVGANVGYMTSALAVRAGLGGRVIAYEPHPLLLTRLQPNVERWRHAGYAIDVRPRAVSDRGAQVFLDATAMFEANEGVARVADDVSRGIQVEAVRLDQEIRSEITILKVDVEGHEPAVLRGATQLLEQHRVAHIVYEDHDPAPTETSALLSRMGYSIFRLDGTWRGPVLRSAAESVESQWEAPNYLATLTPAAAHRLIGPKGWHCLRGRRPRVLARR